MLYFYYFFVEDWIGINKRFKLSLLISLYLHLIIYLLYDVYSIYKKKNSAFWKRILNFILNV